MGNWTYSHSFNDSAPEASRNQLFLQREGTFTERELPAPPGYTLSVLCSDLNRDGFLDLSVGNDFGPHDAFYFGNGEGGLRLLRNSDNVIPPTPTNTMSISAADVNNDLSFELLVCGISFGSDLEEKRNRTIPYRDVGFEYDSSVDRIRFSHAFRWHRAIKGLDVNPSVSSVFRFEPNWLSQDFLALAGQRLAMRRPQGEPDWLLSRLPAHMTLEQEHERRYMLPGYVLTENEEENRTPQRRDGKNTFGVLDDSGVYQDRAAGAGLQYTDWTWNAKFADLDNDGWQDLYVANGFFMESRRGSNRFLRKVANDFLRFEDKTSMAGVGDYLATSAYTYVDFDCDGDIDIVSVPINGPVRVFENLGAGTNAVSIELRDHIGNHFGIGSKVIISYGSDSEMRQIREIQPGGGYLSFDPPIAQFGLGEDRRFYSIEVQWSTGETTVLRGEWETGAFYRVIRHAPQSEQGASTSSGIKNR